MCKTGTEGEEMFGKKSLVQWNNSGEATLLEGQPPTGEAWFAAQATIMALLRFTTQWRQHAEVRSDLHVLRSFTRSLCLEKDSRASRLNIAQPSRDCPVSPECHPWPLYSDTPVTCSLKDSHHPSFSHWEMYFLPSGHLPTAAVPLLCQTKFLLRHPHVSLRENM